MGSAQRLQLRGRRHGLRLRNQRKGIWSSVPVLKSKCEGGGGAVTEVQLILGDVLEVARSLSGDDCVRSTEAIGEHRETVLVL